MYVDLVRGKQPNFAKFMSNAQKKLCCQNLSWDQKKEKMKTDSEYLYYIPREVTLSLYDCEPLQWTLRGVIKYIYG